MLRIFELNLNHPAHYVSVGPFSVSTGNLTIIISMFAIFVVALFLPFPDHAQSEKHAALTSEKR